ncbi:DUF4239 domain-containing protein [Candidatus Uabimicrobium sp. HlEnr_7]|uniref:bestrophin-like domain n=1 Tax=Candidatus Uabimicrobium helgolandensis TaxID=3095367 RepID=UPI0035579F3B
MFIYIRAALITAAAIGGSYYVHSNPHDFLPIAAGGDTGGFEIFFSILGTIYAVMSGFVMLVVLDNYTKIKDHLAEEVNSLQDLRDFLLYVDNQEENVQNVKDKLKVYVDSLVGTEWSSMMKKKKVHVDTSDEIYSLMDSIHKLEISNDSDQVALGKLIEVVGRVTTLRTERLTACSEALPRSLLHVMLLLSWAVIIVFMLVPVGNFFMIVALNGFVAFVVTMIYGMIQDLNNPFKGSWRLKPDLFVDLQKNLHRGDGGKV